ncbi:hypothetical protein PP7435_CHR1-1175 [Komagataella phaffii CBS 7435]|uniref:K Homology domain-containing protein n=2 Tax=Komagataella phaffii TaxID=460519 RepID=C4QYB0_KOMPG|nr:uncharacterized protein PAS_chr1-4_0389 [Komagataella phaffii GS115]AOA61095.1 GQ67_01778T0 [Komagataella phaffii]CAH2447056.1 hypothetical protein BQ9382_C1-6190 [Komagataella phaffii CBS 7435]AOA66917.1 GQ68_01793T0 [Komagataella phaffii GS115]CAY68233.1 Protein of unknown function that may interact with ribosomes [Komagataella phaffii GS115]CCA37304.1 hypothetical protein PP7435_CHR1-1175 [Komagataella phaffii CBS 7435]
MSQTVAGCTILKIPLKYSYFTISGPDHENFIFDYVPSKLEYRILTEDVKQKINSSMLGSFQGSNTLLLDNEMVLTRKVAELNVEYNHGQQIFVSLDRDIDKQLMVVSFIGGLENSKNLALVKNKLLSSYFEYKRDRIELSADTHRFLFSNGEVQSVRNTFRTILMELADYCNVYISILYKNTKTCSLNVIGNSDAVDLALNKIRIAIDGINPDKVIDYVSLEHASLTPLLGGLDFFHFKKIMQETMCTIYLPNLLPQLFNFKSPSEAKIYITGNELYVSMAKNAIKKLLDQVKGFIYLKEVMIKSVKRDLLILDNNKLFLENLIRKTGCFIQIPTLGVSENYHDSLVDIIRIQGSSAKMVEECGKLLMEFITSYYHCNYTVTTQLPTGENDVVEKVFHCLQKIAVSQDAVVSATVNPDIANNLIHLKFQVNSKAAKIRKTIPILQSLPLLLDTKFLKQQVQFHLELSNEERVFIEGKKNGKLMKIMQKSNVAIKLSPFNEHNLILQVICENISESLIGLKLLEDELPKIVTFNVPECFHRQIIGVGGSTVQTIMRKHNVFIKFFNSVEHGKSPPSFPSAFVRKDNVVIKCPSKNKAGIPEAKVELQNLVEKFSKCTYLRTYLKLTRSHWRLLTDVTDPFHKTLETTDMISDLEKKTNTFVNFPIDEPSPIFDLEIAGLENNSELSANSLSTILPVDHEFKIQPHQSWSQLQNADQRELPSPGSIGYWYLESVVLPLKLLNVEVQIFPSEIQDENADAQMGANSIVLSYFKTVDDSTSSKVSKALEILENFLTKYGFEIMARLIRDPASYIIHKSKGQVDYKEVKSNVLYDHNVPFDMEFKEKVKAFPSY